MRGILYYTALFNYKEGAEEGLLLKSPSRDTRQVAAGTQKKKERVELEREDGVMEEGKAREKGNEQRNERCRLRECIQSRPV